MAATVCWSAGSTRRGQPKIGNPWPARRRETGGQGASGAGPGANHSARTRKLVRQYRFLFIPLSRDRGLPARHFPRLPLYAFIPSGGYQGGNAAYLQRARFLAIAEFGPRSLIYHEGRAYRVNKARLRPELRTPECRLATDRLFICDNCGSAHAEEAERCMACGDSIAGVHPIFNILRIDNVETLPAERITANDEERQRQGFDIQTVFAWSKRDGAPDVERGVVRDTDGPFLAS